MSRRRGDRFIRDISRSRRDRQRRKSQRSQKRAQGEMSAIEEKTDNFVDMVSTTSREFGMLGVEVGKGVAREFLSMGVDFLVTFSTLGLVETPSMRSANRLRRRRRRH